MINDKIVLLVFVSILFNGYSDDVQSNRYSNYHEITSIIYSS